MSTKYFGTDGIRGKANEKLTPELAYKVGRYLAYKLKVDKDSKFLIGRDTRLSGEMLESALASGLMASGLDVDLLDVVVTPLVSHILKEEDYVGGIMISASHNPYYDNGLKIMGSDGLKIDSFLQDEVEDYLNGKIEIPYAINDNIGVLKHRKDLVESYVDYLKSVFTQDFSKLKICVDAANGSTYDLSRIFSELGMDATVINNDPNGININDNCGSTHPEFLQSYMSDKDFDLGVAFDGDGDRLVFVDRDNNIVDGDGIIYILSTYYKEKNELENNTSVVTVMSNLGLHKALKRADINVVITDVGDKNVFEKMVNDNYIVGGEQSGHIIVKKHSNMGDGILVTLKILSIMSELNLGFNELLSDLKIYPQLLENTYVKNTDFVLNHDEVVKKINEVKTELGENGRILVRASGTEPLVRVMVEAESEEICSKHVSYIIETIKQIEAW